MGALRDYLGGREPEAILWPGAWSRSAATMLRRDLKAAGIAYEDADGLVADFHAVTRVSFITMLAHSGVHPKTAQDRARHSDVNLTLNVYIKLTRPAPMADCLKVA